MVVDASLRPSRAPFVLVVLVGLCVLCQLGGLISLVMADTGGGAPSTAVTPDLTSDQVAATPAEFRVDETGAATYSIPLYAVPGTAGVTPRLTLSYSSQGAYGPVGKGWTIGGLSAITRCRGTREAGDFIVAGVPTDGDPTPINYSGTDRYCLDGQRLIPVADSPACPTSGLPVQQLRTEIESFQRVCAYGDPTTSPGIAFFTVERKDGSISWYGDRDNNATANRADGYFNSTAPNLGAYAMAWAQTRFQDSTGNYIDYLYLENPSGASNGEQLLSEVRYTGKTVLSGQAGTAKAPYARLVFGYSTRPSLRTGTGYAIGGVLTQSRRLETIAACTNGSGGCYLAYQARFYQLTYADTASGSGLDTLTSVQECSDGNKAVCLPATTFQWSQARNELTTFEQPATTLGNWNSPFEGMKYGDVDGDGRQDMVYLLDGVSGHCPTESVYVGFSRLDASNRLNLVNNDVTTCTPTELISEHGRGDGSWALLDYDGDGRDDLFVSDATGTAWKLYPSVGAGNANFIFDNTRNLIAGITIPSVDTPEDQPQLADLNGDGLIDVVYPSGGELRARLMERNGGSFGWGAERSISFDMASLGPLDPRCSSGYSCDESVGGTPITRTGFLQMADFNGDGASDLLVKENVNGQSSGCTMLAPSRSPALASASQSDASDRVLPYKMEDLSTTTAQGRAAAAANSTCDQFFLPSLHAMTVTGITATTITMASAAELPGNYATLTLGDMNGDGLTDVFYRQTATSNWSYRINTGRGMSAAIALPAISYTERAQFVDVNGDGRTDFIFPDDNATYSGNRVFSAYYAQMNGTWSARTPLGSGGFACVSSCGSTDPYVNLFADIDGDGAMDHLTIRQGDTPNVYVSRADPVTSQFKPRDVITSISNGLGAKTTINYGALTNRDLYRRDSGSRNRNWGRGAPIQDVIAPTYVVASVASSSPQAGNPSAMSAVHYRYAGAKVQAGGRGFLGFREIVTIDANESGGYVTTQSTFYQDFPYIGLPATTVKRAAIGQAYIDAPCLGTPGTEACFDPVDTPAFPVPAGTWFSDQAQIWESDTDSAGTAVAAFVPGIQAPVHVRTSGTEEKLADPFGGGQTSRVVTTFGYGANGNALSTTVDTYTSTSTAPTATVLTSNTYADTLASWHLGRLSTSSVTHRRPNRADVVRTASFSYAATTGLLTVEQTQPGASVDLALRKEYSLDDYGNRVAVRTCAGVAACPIAAPSAITFHPSGLTIQRYTRAVYDTAGRYPLASYEPFWNGTAAVEAKTQTVVARNEYGDVTQAYDVNGRDTLAVNGTFGRPYYTWTETVAGSVPGASSGGASSTTSYRWCTQVSCPTGAVFRQKVVATGAPTQWTYFDVLSRPIFKAAETFNISVSGKDLVASCTTYDATGKTNQSSNPFFLPGTEGADPSGLASACTAGAAWTTTTYDVLGRPLKITSPDQTAVTNDYFSLTTTSTDARNNSTARSRNGKGELTQVLDANGLSVTYWYLADGSMYLVSRDAGRGAVQNSFQFDTLGRKTVQADPDGGVTTFEYNALGELTAQQDSLGNRIENEIDARGRVWRKTVKQANGTVESQSTYTFDTAANGLGQMASETITGIYTGWVGQGLGVALNYSRSYSYDQLGRPLGSVTGIDGVNYTAAVQYDALGRAWKAQDVSGGWIKTEFNPRGMSAAICPSTATDNVATCAAPWQRTVATDAWGHVVNEALTSTSQMSVARTYEPLTGRAGSICADSVATGACGLVDESYAWDAAGNLSSQLKTGRYLENFTYDSLNRLTRAQMIKGATTTTLDEFDYDRLGNTCRKVMLGTATLDFTYIGRSGCGLGGNNSAYGGGGTGTTGAHQVGGITGSVFYYYDTRGNQTIKDALSATYDRTVRYSLDDKAYEATSGTGVRTRFWYGSDGQRYKREDGTQRTLYLGNVEIVTNGATSTFKRSIGGVVLQTVVGSISTDYYLFHDQLGSLVKITDATGAVVNKTDFTASGYRRDYDTQGIGGQVPTLSTRGFTGHEMVDGVLAMIHMNGRVFDPALGRFMQVDPVIQAPDNTQSWNAYTYVLNNPYTFTDPTGALSQKGRQAIAIVAMIVAACCGHAEVEAGLYAWGFAITVAGGFISGAIASQSLKGGLEGAFTAAISFGIINGIGSELGQIAAQAASGGIMETLEGGKFGYGFMAAGLTAAFMPQVGHIGNDVARTAIGAIIGGAISEGTGGKFANGAISGAIQAAMAGGDDRASDLRGQDDGQADADVSRNYDPKAQVDGYDLTLVDKGSTEWKNATGPKAENDPAKIEVIAHGCESGRCLFDYKGRSLNANQVVALIRTYTDFNSNPRPIELDACFTGRGQNSLAQQVANQLRQPVSGPTLEGQIYPSGRYGVRSPGVQRVFPPQHGP